MNINLLKKISVIFICLLMIFSLTYCIYASDPATFINGSLTGKKENLGDKATEMSQNIIGTILSVIRTVAAAIAVVILIVIACKYIIASAGDRADIKKYAINYIIGAVILFGASGILTLVQKLIQDSLN